MADRFYGVAVGGDMTTNVTVGASTGSTTFEFRATHDATGASRISALQALEAIKHYIQSNPSWTQ